jgi:hypothetical protein
MIRKVIFILFLCPAFLFAQSNYSATSIQFWGGLDIINAHASGTVTHPLTGNRVSSSAGGFGGGIGILFALDQRSAIGLETGYLLTESIAEAIPSSAYTEFILPVLVTGQVRIIGVQKTSGMSIQGGLGVGVLYRTEARAYPYSSTASLTNDGAGFLGYIGPQAELALVDFFSLQATGRFYFTSLDVSTDKSMLYFGCGFAFTF